jgi:hypothetical protein
LRGTPAETIYLHPLDRDPKTITFNLMHFSGAGMGSGTSANRAAIKNNSPGDQEAAAMQKVTDILLAERDRDPTGESPDPTLVPRIIDVMRDYLTTTIIPSLDAAIASRSEGRMQAAVYRALSLLGQMEILGDNDPATEVARRAVFDAFTKMLEVRSDEALKRCLQDHKPEQIITLRGTERIKQLLGVTTDLHTEEKVEQCGKFELHFLSSMSKKANVPMFSYLETMEAEADVPLSGDPGRGSAPLRYGFELTMDLGGLCSVIEAHGNPDTFTVLALEFDMNPKAEEDPCGGGKHRAAPHAVKTDAFPADAPFKIVSMRVNVGNPTEEGTLRCNLPFFDLFHKSGM